MKPSAAFFASTAAALLFVALSPTDAATRIHRGWAQNNYDSAEDLTLTGKIIRAVQFTNSAPALRVNGLQFVPHSASPGLVVSSPSFILPQGTRTVELTDINMRNFETILGTALTGSPAGVSVSIPVTPGKSYVLQLLFYGNKQENRRWDVEVEGDLVLDEITSLGAEDSDPREYSEGGFVSYRCPVTAGDNTLTIRMGSLGGTTDGGLREPLLQALTLEEVVPDTDDDGLPDEWEIETFGSLESAGSWSDDDGDSLDCLAEYHLGTDPRDPSGYDSDNDVLSDGDEYFRTFTNPLVGDTDGDGLKDGYEDTNMLDPLHPDTDGDGVPDGDEVLIHNSNPLKRDSDDDGFADSVEVARGTEADNPYSLPLLFTTSTAFSGAGPDEGLDLRGIFTTAVSLGSPGVMGSWRVENAVFRPWHEVAGLTSSATRYADEWLAPAFPSPAGTHDVHLAMAVSNIQYDPVMNFAVPGLVPGRHYKLQLLFAEGCCAGRGFDVFVEGTQIADEFAVMPLQGGSPTSSPARGAALVHGFLAGDAVLNLRLDTSGITTPELNDPNAILNALTIEEAIPGTDSDSDTLPDAWERHFFGNLSQEGETDPDGDGQDNSMELQARTNPALPDTDDDGLQDGYEFNNSLDGLSHDTDLDGLSDGEEVNTILTKPDDSDTDDDGLNDYAEVHVHFSSPNIADTDEDTLPDGVEALTLHSSPVALDTDGDGYSDPTEFHSQTNPADASHGPGATHVATVFGLGPAGGLDLAGNFRYAVNIGANTLPETVGSAVFTSAAATPGVTVTGTADVANWTTPYFGNDLPSKALARVFSSMRWKDAMNAPFPDRSLRVTMQGLTPGTTYRLQLLFSENYGPKRYFNINVNGVQVARRFNIAAVQVRGDLGAAFVHRFTAPSATAEIELVLTPEDRNHGEDGNPLLCGFTLEELPPVPAYGIGSVQSFPAGLRLTLTGASGRSYALDHSTDLKTWRVMGSNILFNAPGPVIVTDSDPARVGPQSRRGFYRLRDKVVDPFPN